MSCDVISELARVIEDRIRSGGESSYTYRLYKMGKAHVARKVGEEAVELILASLAEDRSRVIEEAADLIYHVAVLLAAVDSSILDVCRELEKRRRR